MGGTTAPERISNTLFENLIKSKQTESKVKQKQKYKKKN
jgi:hypothetical protein